MNVGSVNQVSFSGTTRKTASGNEYEKCKVGTIAGFAYGALASAVTLSMGEVQSQIDESITTSLSKSMAKQAKSGKVPNVDLTRVKNIRRTGMGLGALCAIGVWTGIGAVIDGAVNNHRRNNADRAALRDAKLEKHLEKKIKKEVNKEVQQKTNEIKAENA